MRGKIFNFQFSIFNLLGAAGVAGATQFLLNHNCHAMRGRGDQNSMDATEHVEGQRLPCLGFEDPGRILASLRKSRYLCTGIQNRTGVLIGSGHRF